MTTWDSKHWLNEHSHSGSISTKNREKQPAPLLNLNGSPEGIAKSNVASFQFSFVDALEEQKEKKTFGMENETMDELTIGFSSLSTHTKETGPKSIQISCTLADLVAGEHSTIFKSVLKDLRGESCETVIPFETLVESEEKRTKSCFNLDAPEFKPPLKESIHASPIRLDAPEFKPKRARTKLVDFIPPESKGPIPIIAPEPKKLESKGSTYVNLNAIEFKPKINAPEFKPINLDAPVFKPSKKPVNLNAPEFKPSKKPINMNAAEFKPALKKSPNVYHNGLFIPSVQHF